jgi:DNA-binding response OmpR family regulator
MNTLFLIHWNAAEAEQLAQPLHSQGWHVEIESEDGARAGKRIKETQPATVVIYLTRLPSHGRETAAYLQATKTTRHIPIIFVGGVGEALERTKAKVSDATYITSEELYSTLVSLLEGTRGPLPPVRGSTGSPRTE